MAGAKRRRQTIAVSREAFAVEQPNGPIAGGALELSGKAVEQSDDASVRLQGGQTVEQVTDLALAG